MLSDHFQGKNVLITGSSGFVGGHLARALHSYGARVHGLARKETVPNTDLHYFSCDILDRDRVKEIVEEIRPAYVFHLAANKARSAAVDDFRECFDENLVGTLNLLDACVTFAGVSRFVAIGTCEEYGGAVAPYSEEMREMPVSAYSCSKVAMTHLLQTFHRIHGFPSVVLRPSLAYGPGQGNEMFLPALIRSLLAGQRFAMSGGEQTRDYVYIDDVIAAILVSALKVEAIGQVINVSSGMPTRIIDIAHSVAGLIGRDVETLLDIGNVAYRKGEAMDYWADGSKARELLGWTPSTGIKDGLRKTIDYYRSL